MDERPRHSVTVRIAGEEHTLRSDADPEYTRECARYVDEAIAEVRDVAEGIERHKSVILAALSITDRLLRTREALEELEGEAGARLEELAGRVRSRAESED